MVRPLRPQAHARAVVEPEAGPLRLSNENAASEPFRYAMLGHDVVDASPAASRAQKFPEAASFRMSFSRVRSEIARRGR